MPFRMSFVLLLCRLFLPHFKLFPFPSEPCIRPSRHLFPGNCWPRIYSQSSMHPDLIESSGRDAFGAGKFILFWQKALAGMISRRKFHPDLMETSCRDDFQRGISSWFDENVWQGWFPEGNFILVWWKCLAGMIFSEEMHPSKPEQQI